MSKCTKIRKKKRQYCSGDLIDEILIQNRTITPPDSGPDFTEEFATNDTVMAAVNTSSGKVFFDGVNTDVSATHEIGFRFDPTVNSSSWILFKGRRLDILNLENLDERDEWFRAYCADKGLATKLASAV